jgi:hypothetical protein
VFVYLSAVLHAEHCHRTVGIRAEVCLLKMETCLNCYINIVTGSLRVRVSRQMAFHWGKYTRYFQMKSQPTWQRGYFHYTQ